jgi:hypothetical protein
LLAKTWTKAPTGLVDISMDFLRIHRRIHICDDRLFKVIRASRFERANCRISANQKYYWNIAKVVKNN